MTGTTPNLALPYPEGTDFVSEGDDAIQALADRLDSVIPTVSSTTYTSTYGGTGGIYEGSSVICDLTSSGLVVYTFTVRRPSGSNTDLHNFGVTVDAKYRPIRSTTSEVAGRFGDTSIQFQVRIQPTGVVQIRESAPITVGQYLQVVVPAAGSGALLDDIEEAVEEYRDQPHPEPLPGDLTDDDQEAGS